MAKAVEYRFVSSNHMFTKFNPSINYVVLPVGDGRRYWLVKVSLGLNDVTDDESVCSF